MGTLLRVLAFPLALCYGLAVRIRNRCFDLGFFCKSISYPIPVISIGNLSAGGTGKTPHIEYLIRFLKNDYSVATLSRGYGRTTRGYRLAGEGDNSATIGDEPMQYLYKFKNLLVSVSESRRKGIEKLMTLPHRPDVILMDDGYQHRWVKPGLSILLTDFHKLYIEDHLLPTGTLREHAAGAGRADIIIVTKSGKVLSPITRRNITEKLLLKPHQKLFFSHITYEELSPLPGIDCPPPAEFYSSLLVFSGIVNTYPFKFYLKRYCREMESVDFPDHYSYKQKDIQKIKAQFEDIFTKRKALVTTEKDAMRLQHPSILSLLKGMPVYYLPIRVAFHNSDGEKFNKEVEDCISRY